MDPNNENLDRVEDWLNGQQEAFMPRPGFVQASRRRLLARIQAEPACVNDQSAVHRAWQDLKAMLKAPSHSWVSRPQSLRSPRLLATLIVVITVALVQNTRVLALSSQTWLPGDQLYPLKASWENASVVLASSTSDRARTHIELTRQRVLEAQALAIEGRYENIPGAVQDLDRHVSGAVKAIQDLAQIDLVQAQELARALQMTLEDQDDLLKLLAIIAPHDARQDLQQAVDITEAGVKALQSVNYPDSG